LIAASLLRVQPASVLAGLGIVVAVVGGLGVRA